MAEPLSPEDFEILQQHLAKFPQSSPCPVCHQSAWDVAGVEAALAFVAGVGCVAVGPIMPVVAVACTTCAFVRHFAWLQVKRSVDDARLALRVPTGSPGASATGGADG